MSTNPFVQLKKLLPEPKLMVATVAATHSDGTITVTYPGGAQNRVRGTGTVSGKVFIRNGVVEGPAPSLTSVSINVG